ncbi:MAG TPA: MopE-related protein, partial [Parafilimonas sp.]|nr:MopE-related protein [Parafilimonas sp.]
MKKILLLVLTTGFFARPILAQEITATASSQYICPTSGVILTYTGGIPNSVWEFFNLETNEWESFASADQPVNPLGLVNMPQFEFCSFRVKSSDGNSYLYSNTVDVENVSILNTPIINGRGYSGYKCSNETVTLELIRNEDGSDYVTEPDYTSLHWSTGETTPSINVNAATTTEYSVTGIDNIGCPFTTEPFTVTVLPPTPPFIQTTSSGSVCSGASVTLSFGGFSTAPPCTLSVNGQYPATAITPASDGSETYAVEYYSGHLGEYSIINVEKGKYYSFFTRTDAGQNTSYSTITSADGSQVYTSGFLGNTIWMATYTGQVRFYSNSLDCITNNAIGVNRYLQCFTDPPASFLWMPGGQTTPSITVNPQSTTNYTLTVSNVSTIQFTGCPGSATQQITVTANSVWYLDADGDGYYTGSGVSSCTSPGTGYKNSGLISGGDCKDDNPAVHPGAPEICGNNIDDNCDGQVDENCVVACGNATSLSTTNVTKSSATLNWTAPVNPVQWQVQYKTTNLGSKWVDAPSVATSARSVTISGLKSNQGYNWHIRAKCGKTWTAYSNAAMFKTTSTSNAIATSLTGNSPFRLYPNPNKGQFVIELNSADKINAAAKIQLIDMTGQVVQTENAMINNGSLQK